MMSAVLESRGFRVEGWKATAVLILILWCMACGALVPIVALVTLARAF